MATGQDEAAPAAPAAGGRGGALKIVAALGIVLVAQALLALCLVSAQQLLVPRNMPFGVSGSPSPVVAAVASRAGLDLTSYPNASAVMRAADRGELYGAYIDNGSSDTLVVVPAKSFFAQTELEPAFLAAAHELGRPVNVRTVKPLADSDPVGAVTSLLMLPLLIGGYLAAVLVFKAARGVAAAPWRAAILIGYALVGAVFTDLIAGPGIGAYSTSHFWPLLPCFWLVTAAVALAAAGIQALVGKMGTLLVAVFGLVQGLMLVPLLIGGYMSSTLLLAATGKAAGRWRAAQLAGFAVISGLVVDLIVCYWLQGFPSSRFWITWPICSLIVAVVAFVAAILQKVLGPIGTLVTVVAMILFGNPSSGGASGVPYLPTFWRDIGPYLPPRNGYLLLHRSIYFDGHGTSESLINLLIYLGVSAAVLIVLDLRRAEASVPADATEAAAMSVPIGAAP